MRKRDDGRWSQSRWKKVWENASGECQADDARTLRYYVTHYVTHNHVANLTPDKDGMVQVQFDFRPRPEATELTAEEGAELDSFLQKAAEAENAEEVPEAAELDFLQKDNEAENTEWQSLWPARLIKLHGIETGASMRIARPPGSLLATISEFVFSKKTLEQIVNPIIADMQKEYCEALAAKRPYKAAWVRVRYCWSFAKTIGFYSLLKVVVEMWRKVSSV